MSDTDIVRKLLDLERRVERAETIELSTAGGTAAIVDATTLQGQSGTYYLARANHTGTQAPSTISPQGSGSGLDADTLDGHDASYFQTATDITEQAQDAVGAMIADTNSIDLAYSDATPSLTAALRLDGTTLTVGVNGVKVTDSAYVVYARQVVAGTGLTGGGVLGSGDVTLNVGAGEGITAAADAIGLTWGTPTITTITPDATSTAGVSTNPARSDHAHAIAAGTPGTIQPDDAAAEGTSTSFARADHTHAIAAASASTQAIGDSAAEGSATSFARSDHKHAMPAFASPTIALGTAAAAGSAATLVRSDATILAFDATAPTTITPDASAAAGSASVAARRDHTHAIAAATPGNIEPDASAAEGSSTSFARADHTHGITAAVAGTIAPDDSAAEGSATSFARSDHRHAIAAAAPANDSVSLAVSAEGTSTSFSRADHTHQLDEAIGPTWTSAHIFSAGATISSGQYLYFGDDVNLYRAAANALKTDDALRVASTLQTHEDLQVLNKAGTGYVEWGTRDVSGTDSLYTLSNLNGVTAATLTLSGDLRVATNVLYANASGQRVGINCAPDAQFDLDILGNLRAQGWIVGKHAIQLSGALLIAHFDGREPYETDFTGEPNGHMGQVATLGGDVMYREGKFGKAVQTGAGTTNLIYNPIMSGTYSGGLAPSVTESDAAGRITASENTDTSYIEVGSSSQKIIVSGGSGSEYVSFSHGTMSNSTQYSWMLRFYLAAGSCRVTAWKGSTTSYSDYSTAGWNTFTLTATTDASGSNFVFIITSPAGSATVYVDSAQIEAKPYRTPLSCGAFPGHAWGGTAYASASTRDAAYLTYPIANIRAAAGTVAMWVKVRSYNTSGGVVWQAGDANGELDAYIGSTGAILFRANGDTGVTSSAGAIAVDTWAHVACTWDHAANERKLYVDGALVDSGTVGDLPTLHASTIGIGYSAVIGTTYIHPGLIDDLVILDRAATADEVRAVYESNAPVFAETSSWMWRTANNIVWADEQGLWMIDSSGSAVLGAYGDSSGTKSWGGKTLAIGDILLGRDSAYVMWDNSAGTLEVAGALTAGTIDIGGADDTSFHVDANGNIWSGAAAYASGVFKVSSAGAIAATSGTIGGWTLGSASLTGGNATLHNTGYALFGTSNDIARVDAADATYRLWVGHATAGSAAFRVTKAGVLTATGASITGALSAATIDIGGADTTSFHVDIDGNVWSGAAAFADGPFRVSNAGALTATSATITGSITGASTLDIGGADTTSFHVDSSGNIWAGAAAFADGVFKVSSAGAVTATSGTIGGWTLAAASLTGGNATLSNTGYGLFGTSNDIARIDASDATYRLWVGHATAGSAPFRVTKAGVLTATGATITGAISAATIDIGGADATSFHVDIDGNVWAGAAAFADGVFKVSNAGALTATSATITGVVTANTGYIGGATGWTIATGKMTSAGIGLATAAGDAIYAFWAGDNTPASAEFSVTHAGALTATSGAIGGWTLGANSITSNNIGIYSGAANTARIQVGTGSALAGLNSGAAGSDIAIWAGDVFANRATCAFHVSLAGEMIARSGSVGGWTMGQYDLHGGSGSTYSRLDINSDTGTYPYALYIGSETANQAPIRMGKTGSFFAGESGASPTKYIRWNGTDLTWRGAGSELNSGGLTIEKAASESDAYINFVDSIALGNVRAFMAYYEPTGTSGSISVRCQEAASRSAAVTLRAKRASASYPYSQLQLLTNADDTIGFSLLGFDSTGTQVTWMYNSGPYVILPGTKATTGNPGAAEGLIYINSYDNKIMMYADGGWRQLASW
jgi:hypothetical protein